MANKTKKHKVEIIVGKDGVYPTQAYTGAAGHDIYAAENKVLKPLAIEKISTDLRFSIPEGYYGKIEERSGVSIKTSLKRKAGVVDSDYRGEVFIVMQNVSNSTSYVAKGDKIAQIIINKIADIEVTEVTQFETPDTDRGDKGFGSSDQ